MCTLDIILLVCFVPSLVRGLTKGFIEQVLGILSVVLGAYFAFHFSGSVAQALAPTFSSIDGKFLNIICFAGIVFVVTIGLRLLSYLLTKLMKVATLGWVNRLAGLFFAIFKTALILGIALSVFDGVNAKLTIIQPSVLEESVVYGGIQNFTVKVFPFLKNLIANV